MGVTAAVAERHATHIDPTAFPVAATQIAMAKIGPGDRVLDLGCRTGSLTLPAGVAAGRHGHAVGVDLDLAMLAEAIYQDSPAASFLCADAYQLPVATRSVTVVLCGKLLDRLDRLDGLLHEIRRVLAPGGRLAGAAMMRFADWTHELAVREVLAAEGIDASPLAGRDDLRPSGEWAGELLADRLRGAGFTDVHASVGEWTVPFPDVNSYVAWRLSLPRTAVHLPAVVNGLSDRVSTRVADRVGRGQVFVRTSVLYLVGEAP